MRTMPAALRKLVRPGSRVGDERPLFSVGTLVRLQSSAAPTGFTCWGRGKGVGEVVRVVNRVVLDVRWPAGRSYERTGDLYVVTG